jgi:thioesterase domain-containing protein
MAESSKIEALQQSWQRVFRRPGVEIDADFFDLGGNTWLAAELFTEINTNFGLELSPATICTSATIAKLAALLDNPQPRGPAILLKAGTQAPPIFMLHGVGSSVIDLIPLVRRVQSAQPIYGLEAQGNDGGEEPLDRIEDIAQSFRATVCEIQPHGPYFLVGYSLGGLVALELAQQLKAMHEEIGLLLMLDSYPDRRYLSFRQYSRLLLQLAKNRISARKTAGTTREPRGTDNRHGQRGSLVRALQRVKDAHYRALRSYRPVFYDGEIKFVRAALASRFPPDPVPVWSPLCRGFEVETVPGEHVTMLTTSIVPLASLIDQYVRESYTEPELLQSRRFQPHRSDPPNPEGVVP